MTEQPQYTNSLIHEKSPYLLQHAHNPVDWHPWGDEAFQIARQRDCPVFLSIGYATCHWCHVMEKESFEEPEVAKHLNETFVCIKVDREELPEVDSLYMEFAQSMMSGAAGWPLNIILTPERFPFFAATYMPPSTKHGMTGVLELIEKIHRIWGSEERTKILEQSQKIVDAFAQDIQIQGELLISKESLKESLETLYKIADPIYGGMRGSPKFPIPYQANLLLRVSKTLKDSRALFLAERTLDMMQRGGICDHLGGGFSRYSVDERWQVPHFEKMLYDNALIVKAYLEAWQLTKKPLYQQVCMETLDYMIRDLKHPEGAFYSAEDADSEGKEGYFYTWIKEEIDEILGDQSAIFCQFYGVTEEGNFEGRNLLHSPARLEEFALKNNLDPLLVAEGLNRSKQKLFQKRSLRERPFRDDKILTSWNGLCLSAMAEASVAFGIHSYLETAQKSARFLKVHVWSGSKLSHRWKDGEALFPGTLEDYAFLIQGLLSLYEASAETEWLEWAMQLNQIIEKFFKEENGAYYQTDSREPNLIIRKTHYSDGAEPSGNAVQCDNLLKLYQMTGEERYREHAEDIIRAVKPFIDNYAPGYCYHLMNINRYYDKHAPTFVIALNETEHYGEEIKRLFYHGFAPHKALVWLKNNDVMVRQLLPEWSGKKASENKTVVFQCEEGRCLKPMTEISDVIEEFQKL